jgi:hypothetical protein
MATRSNLPPDHDMKRNRSLYCSDPNCTSCKELRQEYEKMRHERPPTAFPLRATVPRADRSQVNKHEDKPVMS